VAETVCFFAVIPARGGSKRIPGKNLADLGGKPLIAWSIEAAQKSRRVERIIVSTDDEKIAETARRYGAEVPFLRPEALAGDTTPTVDVLIHLLETLKKSGEDYDYLVLLQPTSPLRTARHVDEAIALALEKEADAVISVCEAEHPPMWCNPLPADGSMEGFIPEELQTVRSQDLPTCYRINGAIYVCRTDIVLTQRTLFPKNNVFAYIMDRESSIDIDEPIDLTLARCLISRQ